MIFDIHIKYTKLYTTYLQYIQDIYKYQAAAARPGPTPRALYIFCIYVCIFCMYMRYHKMAIVMACLNCHGIPNLLVFVFFQIPIYLKRLLVA